MKCSMRHSQYFRNLIGCNESQYCSIIFCLCSCHHPHPLFCIGIWIWQNLDYYVFKLFSLIHTRYDLLIIYVYEIFIYDLQYKNQGLVDFTIPWKELPYWSEYRACLYWGKEIFFLAEKKCCMKGIWLKETDILK